MYLLLFLAVYIGMTVFAITTHMTLLTFFESSMPTNTRDQANFTDVLEFFSNIWGFKSMDIRSWTTVKYFCLLYSNRPVFSPTIWVVYACAVSHMSWCSQPLRCRDPALPALYGYPLSAIFRYAVKRACASTHASRATPSRRGMALRG